MAQQQINIGAAPNDGNGETLRDAFGKVNANAQDAENRLQSVEQITDRGPSKVVVLGDDDASSYTIDETDPVTTIGLSVTVNVDTPNQDAVIYTNLSRVKGNVESTTRFRIVIVRNPGSENLVIAQTDVLDISDFELFSITTSLSLLRPFTAMGTTTAAIGIEVLEGNVTIDNAGTADRDNSSFLALEFKDVNF